MKNKEGFLFEGFATTEYPAIRILEHMYGHSAHWHHMLITLIVNNSQIFMNTLRGIMITDFVKTKFKSLRCLRVKTIFRKRH